MMNLTDFYNEDDIIDAFESCNADNDYEYFLMGIHFVHQNNDVLQGNWINKDDVDKLVKVLDVALNGNKAAPQASLCDIVTQVIVQGIKAPDE